MTSAALEETAQQVEQALVLLRKGRYSDLISHAAQMGSGIGALEELRSALESGQPSPADVRSACEQLKSRVAVLSEVFRHAAMVECGLREIELAFTAGYSQQGHYSSSSGSRLSAEA